jgi:hypothetical protein
MIRKALTMFIVLVFISIIGCSRHVVVEPEAVANYKDSDWIIKSSPSKTGR